MSEHAGFELCDNCLITAPLEEMWYNHYQLTDMDFRGRLEWFCKTCVFEFNCCEMPLVQGRNLVQWSDEISKEA